MDILERIRELEEKVKNEFSDVKDLDELEDLRVKYLGKKGEIQKIFNKMSEIKDEKKPVVGKETNILKNKIENYIEDKKKDLAEKRKKEKIEEERIDVTLPGIKQKMGHQHILTKVMREVEDVFIGLGFTIEEGPEIESEYYNFKALNIPEGHPARDLQDTFYIDDNFLLRTHTSPVQVRTMEKERLPIRMIAPGRVYRSDELDASHSPNFHQVEGLVIDKDISFSDLKGSIETIVKKLYGENREIRFRPSYFPFTEPSAEVDVSCVVCEGEGCSLCSNTGWLEVMGSGMVHPNVLKMSGIDPNVYSGFAFGMGWDRIAMLKYGIDDIRLLFENDARFLEQF
ncbi:MAG TPA: phenylalanine--tRNA ligase subunit alpha [Halanaerobiales bacterium]|nr:phenylalanine--tRNA ligase subunit alpha [Halanaerobiales bacterium]